MFKTQLWQVRGLLLALTGIVCLYLPCLGLSLDFEDDGAIAYAPQEAGGLERWTAFWSKSVGEFQSKGPFRPLTWFHWDLETNLFEDQAFPRRILRGVWCLLSAGLWLLLLIRLGIPGSVVCWTLAFAFWNPYRNEIWMAFGLTEAFATPYAAGALLAALQASRSVRSWGWDALAFVLLTACVAVKITFIALVPAVVVLRILGGGLGWREGIRRHLGAGLFLASVALLPLGQFLLYARFTATTGYRVGLNPAQLSRVLQGVARAGSILFLLAPLCVLLFLAWRARSITDEPAFTEQAPNRGGHAIWWTGLALLASGCVVYLPINGFAGRYSIPAVWGWDLCLAAGLAMLFVRIPKPQRFWCNGLLLSALVVLAGTNLIRQDRLHARQETLWSALRYVETEAPPGATVIFVGDSFSQRIPNAPFESEGYHFNWHLMGRGRTDLRVRVVLPEELPSLDPILKGSDPVCLLAREIPDSLRERFAKRQRFEHPAWSQQPPLACWVGVDSAALSQLSAP